MYNIVNGMCVKDQVFLKVELIFVVVKKDEINSVVPFVDFVYPLGFLPFFFINFDSLIMTG